MLRIYGMNANGARREAEVRVWVGRQEAGAAGCGARGATSLGGCVPASLAFMEINSPASAGCPSPNCLCGPSWCVTLGGFSPLWPCPDAEERGHRVVLALNFPAPSDYGKASRFARVTNNSDHGAPHSLNAAQLTQAGGGGLSTSWVYWPLNQAQQSCSSPRGR